MAWVGVAWFEESKGFTSRCLRGRPKRKFRLSEKLDRVGGVGVMVVWILKKFWRRDELIPALSGS